MYFNNEAECTTLCLDIRYFFIVKLSLLNLYKQKWKGRQSGTYLRQMGASSGLQAFTSQGYPAPLIHKQLFRGLHHPNPSPPSLENLTPCFSSPPTILALTVSNRSSVKVSISSPQIHQPRTFLPNPTLPPSENPQPPPTHCRHESLPHRSATPTGSQPCNRPRCKTCPIHHPANSFTSSCTNVTYPITTHAKCKVMNLIYQLQCTECNAFYIEETHRSLSDRMNRHWFTNTVLNPDLPVAIHTQSHQIPFQECWSVSVIHKLPDSTPDHIRCQFETVH